MFIAGKYVNNKLVIKRLKLRRNNFQTPQILVIQKYIKSFICIKSFAIIKGTQITNETNI